MAKRTHHQPAPTGAAPRREPITDSAWFWFALFTAVGLAALLATGGRLGKRQAGIENKYQARAGVASGQIQVETSDAGVKTAGTAPRYSTPEAPVIPLWPLEVLLAAIFLGSLAMLLRQRIGQDRPLA
ncbi:MAG: hypothetical protein DCC67_16425 [Planctomycetota bacterium]|nr:MAG: hypothetical protein DCC67_16425 [Planctomycetota bacterium]